MNAGVMFFNPSSGVKLPPSELSALESAAVDAGLELFHVSPDLDIDAIVRERLRRGRCLAVAVGGDGTIHHVMQSLVNNPDATLAVIPATTHMQVTRRDTILLPVLEQFFAAHPGV